MSEYLWEIFCVVLGSQAIFHFFEWIIERHDKRKESPERKMLRALGSDRLYVLLCDWKHNEGGEASEWETVENLFDGYSALGGNGEIRKLYTECQSYKSTD